MPHRCRAHPWDRHGRGGRAVTDLSPGLLERFIAAARAAAGEGLVRGASGNLSWRIDDGRVLVTATGAWLGELAAADVVPCDLSGAVAGAGRPTMEVGLHLCTLRERPDVAAVLHFQSPAATAVACARYRPALDIIPEVPYYLGPVATVPYTRPGSPELAAAVAETLADHDVALLENHGAVAVGADLRQVLQRAITLELVCDVLLRAGGRVRTLPVDAIADLRDMRREGGGV